MPAHLIQAPIQLSDANGLPVSGGSIEFYEPNGSSTPKAVYSDKALTTSAGTTVALNALGMPSTELFGDGDYYIVVKYADTTTAYDMEYIEGEGSGNNAAEEWVDSVTPTYISATSFSVPGDLTSDFHTNRRVKTENTGGTVYSTIVSAVFSSVTTVTVVNDSGTLDSGLSSVELGFLRADNQSIPAIKQGINDVNDNEVLEPASVASAVNHVKITNAATGNPALVEATGDDGIIDLKVAAKGSAGRVIIPHSGALARRSGSLLIPNNSSTSVPFDGEWYDTNSIHDNATNNTRLTVPTGVTKVKLSFYASFSANSTGIRTAYIYKNGSVSLASSGLSLINLGQRDHSPSGSGESILKGNSPVLQVTGGDYFELLVYQNSGAGLTLGSTVNMELEIIE